ncbi:nucleolysin TIAR-like isoform X2 [Linepithema humile]|uniref:nucleolysin TIAR-like isoform X2 n=1 Tax=Linepithema humile TaxID=83485 RepID=UPI00351F7CED
MSDDTTPKTLYIGNLNYAVSEDLLFALFSHIGIVKSCKIIREPGNDCYAFVEFADHIAASAALTALNQRLFLEKSSSTLHLDRPPSEEYKGPIPLPSLFLRKLLQLEWALLMDDEKRRDVSRWKKSGEMGERSR